MSGAFVPSLTIDRLRACQNNFLHGQILINDNLIKHSRATAIDEGELTKVSQIILICGKMKDGIYSPQRLLHITFIADIPENEFNPIRDIGWLLLVVVDGGFETVKDADLISFSRRASTV